MFLLIAHDMVVNIEQAIWSVETCRSMCYYYNKLEFRMTHQYISELIHKIKKNGENNELRSTDYR